MYSNHIKYGHFYEKHMKQHNFFSSTKWRFPLFPWYHHHKIDRWGLSFDSSTRPWQSHHNCLFGWIIGRACVVNLKWVNRHTEIWLNGFLSPSNMYPLLLIDSTYCRWRDRSILPTVIHSKLPISVMQPLLNFIVHWSCEVFLPKQDLPLYNVLASPQLQVAGSQMPFRQTW